MIPFSFFVRKIVIGSQQLCKVPKAMFARNLVSCCLIFFESNALPEVRTDGFTQTVKRGDEITCTNSLSPATGDGQNN